MRGSFRPSPLLLTLALGSSLVAAVRSRFHASGETRSGPGVERDEAKGAAPEPAAVRLLWN
jgi:hypothetical protein